MFDTDFPAQNRLLATLPAGEYDRLAPYLEQVHMSAGQILHEAGAELHHVYFPTTAIVSLLCVMNDGWSSEIAGIGNEGMLGVALIMGSKSMRSRAMVLCPGTAYRLKSIVLMDQLNRSGALQQVLLRYSQALITQMSQISACNRHHSLDQQLCGWLASCLDRACTNELTLTQEMIAGALGVRRESVTEAAGKLQQLGLIRYRRGHITVLDRSALEDRACKCYMTVKTEYERLLPNVAAWQANAHLAHEQATPMAHWPRSACIPQRF